MTVTIYTLNNCGYCKVAKELLAFKGVEYAEVNIPGDMPTRDFVMQYPGIKQFPLIIDEASIPIGGFRDLQEWLKQREEKQLLNEQITGLSI